MEWLLLFLFVAHSAVAHASHFQCLTCDNYLDGPGCGEFTRPIAVRRCATFCYLAIIQNRSASLRAIRDCSPYADMNIEGNVLLKSKVASLASADILTLRRCDSEQCNNDFYLSPAQFLSGSESAYRRIAVPLWLVSFVIIFHYSQSMF